MDFVTGLPPSEGFDAILVVVDRLIKMRHLIPCNETAGAQDVARMYLEHVRKLYGLPTYIVSDRGPQFTATFWSTLCRLLRITPRLSTPFHPRTDGQTERANAVMDQYLRSYVSYQQEDWTAFLGMAEFAANNHVSETTGASPFVANQGFNPCMNFLFPAPPAPEDSVTAIDLASHMQQIHDHLRSKMRYAQDR